MTNFSLAAIAVGRRLRTGRAPVGWTLHDLGDATELRHNPLRAEQRIPSGSKEPHTVKRRPKRIAQKVRTSVVEMVLCVTHKGVR
jgi:hypothetical protein